MTNEELVLEYQSGNTQVIDKIIKNNEKMVRKLASKFYTNKTNAIDEEDLYQEGCIGLIVACKKYDFSNPNRTKFINYAVYWIYKKMHKFIGLQQTNEEVSLNKKLDNSEEELADTLIDEKNYFVKAEDCMYYKQIRKELGNTMQQELSLVEQHIIKLHYGWDSSPLSIKELSYTYKMKSNDIRKMNNKSLKKLRDSSWGRNEIRNRYA